MRELRFRAWDIAGEGFIAGFNMFNYHNYFTKGLTRHLCRYDSEWTDEEYILEQYTEVKDKNGVSIFEGDIVTGRLIDAKLDTRGVIEFDKEHVCFCNKNEAGLTPLFKIADIEVIGNIHRNPGLY